MYKFIVKSCILFSELRLKIQTSIDLQIHLMKKKTLINKYNPHAPAYQLFVKPNKNELVPKIKQFVTSLEVWTISPTGSSLTHDVSHNGRDRPTGR